MSQNSGKQLVWIFSGLLLVLSISVIDFRFFDAFAWIIYGAVILLLVGVLIFGREIAGSKSWFDFGFMRLQPAEFAKFSVLIALAKTLDRDNKKVNTVKSLILPLLVIAVPFGLIMLQGDTGSALVFTIFVLVLYREGLPGWILGLGFTLAILFVSVLFLGQHYIGYLAAGIFSLGLLVGIFVVKTAQFRWLIGFAVLLSIAFIFSVRFIITDVLKPHQQKRIEVLINPDSDLNGAGWQVNQSKIAIGSGGVTGKGFLKGTQTKFNFVPDQSTDFIFCTVGEEHGWIGSITVSALFFILIFRLITLAERQKSRFARVYGYGVASILFFHYAINVGMTVGVVPVIGIPLPFFSYGGSSLWAFTVLLFVFIKLDAHRMEILARS